MVLLLFNVETGGSTRIWIPYSLAVRRGRLQL